jgi:hypothetical protein
VNDRVGVESVAHKSDEPVSSREIGIGEERRSARRRQRNTHRGLVARVDAISRTRTGTDNEEGKKKGVPGRLGTGEMDFEVEAGTDKMIEAGLCGEEQC